MIKKPGTIRTLDDVNKFAQDVYSNLGADDLKATGHLTEAPTVDELNPGQQKIVEISGVPWIYYKTLEGVLYKIQMTLA